MSVSSIKYMGSKRSMLLNGLGKVIDRELSGARRFIDLFAGSASVAVHVAKAYRIPVHAYDLQAYSVAIAAAAIERTKPIDCDTIWTKWLDSSSALVQGRKVPRITTFTKRTVQAQRNWCAAQTDLSITRAYGGHYFSAEQAVWLDALRSQVPQRLEQRNVAVAALVYAASYCAAAPGHTAQPFQPTPSAMPYLEESWRRDVVVQASGALRDFCKRVALVAGNAKRADANEVASSLQEGDLAFIDPPYSGVHYSRFYHVLETVALGSCGEVSGVGRYPKQDQRPRSQYSIKSESSVALEELLAAIAAQKAKAILTFPDHECSNGLSGGEIREIAGEYFKVKEEIVSSKFSTLGGHKHGEKKGVGGRVARQNANELILILRP